MLERADVSAATWAIVGGRPPAEPGAPLNVPLVAASTFIQGAERIYSRNEATPGWEALEALVGGLEGGEAVAFASGMAACAAVLQQLPSGARLVLGDDCYQGVAGIAEAGARDHGWAVERLPVADPAWPDRAQTADLLWVESPSNPLLDVADVAAICAAPRRPGTRVVVDNTFATPLGQQPLTLGADLVVHSATKFIGGHSDLLLGLAVTADEEQLRLLRTARGLNGATPGTLECFLALRGARTLPLRLRQATATAQLLAGRLAAHAAVTRVRYPGFGAIVSFELADAPAADALCAATRIVRHATSLGGVETTMERRAAHPGQEHIPAGLIRMSVGCEDAEDLWADLAAALG
ncbi:PLP-dependent transferase [Paraconexibacter antarcticus]|uniref:PLP-dependent transferase n=1 Tax=Paraconexibacter antarcticus TaxID=2949664 RepID=A0ABY5E1E4_9ACTN|nr:PLP-dependent transferase [Paraconexibacter antarcticus]UTI66657.1 PLP-dependent transferase [Paraconexibacter antarcticus]